MLADSATRETKAVECGKAKIPQKPKRKRTRTKKPPNVRNAKPIRAKEQNRHGRKVSRKVNRTFDIRKRR